MIEKIKNWFNRDDLKLGGVPRSSKWPACKREFALTHPKVCAVCGSKKVQLHHKKPFYLHPELELDQTNLIWLCEGLLTVNHHLWFGHLGNFKSYNLNLDEWITSVKNRP